MNRSTPGLPVHHQLPEFTQTHIHRVGDAIQPSHPLSSPSPPVPNPSQHQSLFQWVNSSHEVAKVLQFQLYRHSLIIRFTETIFYCEAEVQETLLEAEQSPQTSFLIPFCFCFFSPQKWGGKNCSSFLWFLIKMELLSSLVDKGPHIISFWKYIF